MRLFANHHRAYSQSTCNNVDGYTSDAVIKIDVEDLLRCMVYDEKDCVGNEVVTQGQHFARMALSDAHHVVL